jgi:LPS export ABC transporter protein LptC
VFVVLLVAACSSEIPEEVPEYQPGQVPDEVFTDFVTEESDSGLTQWRLTAPRANRFAKRKLVLLDKPVIEFFNRQGERTTTLVSEKGKYSEETRDMLAYGNVVVRSVDGDILETDSLRWDSTTDKITTDNFVTLTQGNNVITGWELEADPNLNSVDIKRDVKARIVDKEGALKE